MFNNLNSVVINDFHTDLANEKDNKLSSEEIGKQFVQIGYLNT